MNPVEKTQNDLIMIAHRGGLYYRPANTFAAFNYIYDRGIRWIELDVRLSSEGIPVVVHDERIFVPGSGNQAVRELTSRQLHAIDVGGGEMLPTLKEVMDRYKDKLNYDIELKDPDGVDKVVPLIRDFCLIENSVITSFIPDALQHSMEIAPEIRRGFLLDRLTGSLVNGRSAIRAARLLKVRYFLPHFRILKRDWVKLAHKEGLRVIAWTVNEPADAQRMIKFGVNGFISDRPDYLLDAISSKSA